LLNVLEVLLSIHDLFTVLMGAQHLFLLVVIRALAECLLVFFICGFVVAVVLIVYICDLFNMLSVYTVQCKGV
jgi:hypothetical protein